MHDVYIAPGVRTPFVKSHGAFGGFRGLELSVPVAKAMSERVRPDFIVWGQVIPDATISNIARELVFEAGLDPEIPAFSTVLACSTSFVGMIQAAGMIGRGGTHLALVGGVETMSHVPIALEAEGRRRSHRHVRQGSGRRPPPGSARCRRPTSTCRSTAGPTGRAVCRRANTPRRPLSRFGISRARTGRVGPQEPSGRDRWSGQRVLRRSDRPVRRRRSRHDPAPRHVGRSVSPLCRSRSTARAERAR